MDNFNLRKYLAENRLLKEWGIRDFTSPPKDKPGPGEYGSIRISVVDDEIDILNDPNNLIDFDYSLEGNELWVWEDDKEEAYNYLGIQ